MTERLPSEESRAVDPKWANNGRHNDQAFVRLDWPAPLGIAQERQRHAMSTGAAVAYC